MGGTFIKCSDGRCIPMPSAGSRDEIATALRLAVAGLVPGGRGVRAAESLTPSGECCPNSPATPQSPALAVAIPGPFDYEKGIFLMRHKFAAVYGESFRALAGLPEDADIFFCHDVIAALLGCEGENVALVTIGTGLGFAHKENGRVQVGPTGSPARPIYNLPWGDGILEDVVSARGLRTAYTRLTGRGDLSAAQIAHLAQNDDEAALQVFSDLGETFGEALAPILEELHIGTLLLAGQISKSLPLFERPLRNALDGIEVTLAPEGAVFTGLGRLADAAKPRFDTLER
ncbi:MAG: ROK family protein [Bacteroidales bacterium]|nr:ROK family protein [Bacteroidales bacterium]